MENLHNETFIDGEILQVGDASIGLTRIRVVGGHLYMVGRQDFYEDNISGALALQFVADDGLTGRRVKVEKSDPEVMATVTSVTLGVDGHVAMLRLDNGRFGSVGVEHLTVIDDE